MKIVVIGNIVTGKSKTIKYVLNKYPGFKDLSIDNIRREFGDGSKEGEEKCKTIFLKQICSNCDNQIIELSGIGDLAENTFHRVCKDSTVLIVYLRAELQKITERISRRVWDIPFPYDTNNIPKAIEHTKCEFLNGIIENHLAICTHCTLVSFQNNTSRDFIENMEILDAIIKAKVINERQ